MREAIPFTRQPQCPKCRGVMTRFKYVWPKAEVPGKPGDEFLLVECLDCEYIRPMETADR